MSKNSGIGRIITALKVFEKEAQGMHVTHLEASANFDHGFVSVTIYGDRGQEVRAVSIDFDEAGNPIPVSNDEQTS